MLILIDLTARNMLALKRYNQGKKEDTTITIKDIRNKLGLTQKEMGYHLGISRISYWYKETGRRAFTAGELLTICKLANVNPLDLSL